MMKTQSHLGEQNQSNSIVRQTAHKREAVLFTAGKKKKITASLLVNYHSKSVLRCSVLESREKRDKGTGSGAKDDDGADPLSFKASKQARGPWQEMRPP
jgi:hypothetical protein